ncbi:MAG TPA: ArsA family ATPase [Conexibacter sp.]|nr:ArsA family ATPase [Conexibacter sp.]
MPGLADKRLVFVTGKGGVGKSTVAIALGIAAARQGLRTIVAELSGQARAAELFGVAPPSGEEARLAAGLHAISVDMEQAMEEYLHERAGRVGDLLAASRAFHTFAHATPGMRELLSIGKVWELAQDRRRVAGAQPYDLVIVDAPATGHAVGALRAPATFAEIARVGPIAYQGRTIDATLRDPAQTAVVAVALPEEMPVTETLALRDRLRDALGQEPAAVVVNACLPERIGPRQAKTLADALDAAEDRVVHAALRAALSEQARACTQREQVARLAAGLDGRTPLELPYLFPGGPASAGHVAGSGTPSADALDASALGNLAEHVEALL